MSNFKCKFLPYLLAAKLQTKVFFLAVYLLSSTIPSWANTKVLKIYIDADYSGHSESSNSIEQGLMTALAEENFTIQGRSVEIVSKDHRGNSSRSRRHIDQFLEDDSALLMVSGIHSPPLLANRKYINENDVPFLVPWAAAGPITRYADGKNWIFRLSIDDSKAGEFIVRYATAERGFKKPILILENTGWGKSNHKSMTHSLNGIGINSVDTLWFDWSLKKKGAQSLAQQIVDSAGDVVFLVGNTIEGSEIIRAMAEHPKGKAIPIVSHWGITGGDFHKRIPHELRKNIDLAFIQTNFSFLQPTLNEFQQGVLAAAIARYPEISDPSDILAPTGFIHAYDLGKLFLSAIDTINLVDDNKLNRANIRSALEQIEGPVEGLLKTYSHPFGEFSLQQPDAHEALNISDYAIARFNQDDLIVLEPWRFNADP